MAQIKRDSRHLHWVKMRWEEGWEGGWLLIWMGGRAEEVEGRAAEDRPSPFSALDGMVVPVLEGGGLVGEGRLK